MKKLLALLLLLSLNAYAQEKRLALVIGNANYSKGALKNPVKDALLMEKTFKELGFDVILDTNIATRSGFLKTIREFGERRQQYNVGFIYYAGHGIQIQDKNYLLATQENYQSEDDVKDNGIEVERLMDYMRSLPNDINVLILDACRNNPFENIWNTASRSLEGGSGLAAITPPSGSMIAFSTQPGYTASDGQSQNSLYCLELSQNMLIENLTLNQVFRNVKTEVRKKSNGIQSPNTIDELEGDAFYLKKSTYMNDILKVDSLIDEEKMDEALEQAIKILAKDPKNKFALFRIGRIKTRTLKENYDGMELIKAAKLFPNDPEAQTYLGRWQGFVGNHIKGLEYFNEAIKLDSSFADAYHYRALNYRDLKKFKLAQLDFDRAIAIDNNKPIYYYNRALFYCQELKDYNNSLKDLCSAIEKDPNNTKYIYDKAVLNCDYLKDTLAAINDFNKILELDSTYIDAITYLGLIYSGQGKLELEIKQYEKGISLEIYNPKASAYCYMNRAIIFAQQKEYDKALADLNKAVSLDPDNGMTYFNRAAFHDKYKKDFHSALLDYSRAIEKDTNNLNYLYNRGILYKDYLHDYNSALIDFMKILGLDSTNFDAINAIGALYEAQGKLDMAIYEYGKGTLLEKSNPKSASSCYSNRATIYTKIKEFDKALADHNKAITLDPDNGTLYYNRAMFNANQIKQFKSAIKDMTFAIEKEPLNKEFKLEMAKLYFDCFNDKETALKYLKMIQDLDSAYVSAINLVGVIYEEQGNLGMAIKEYEKGILLEKLNPNAAAFCYNNRADIYSINKDFEKAQADHNKAISLEPENGYRYYRRAIFYNYYMKDFNNAVYDLTKAIELETINPSPDRPRNLYGFYIERGKLYGFELNDYQRGLYDLQKALSYDTNDVYILNWIGAFYDRFGDEQNALKYYDLTTSKIGLPMQDSAWAYSNGIAWAYSNKAAIDQKNERFDAALENYNSAIKYDVNASIRYQFRSFHNLKYLNKVQDANNDLNKAIKIDPANPDLYYSRAIVNETLKKTKETLADFDKSIQLSESLPYYLDEKGRYFIRIKDFPNAISILNKILHDHPSFKHVHHSMGELYASVDSVQKAEYHFSTALKEIEKDTTGNYLYGEYWFNKKQYQRSLIYYGNVISILENRGNYSVDVDPFENIIYLSDAYRKSADAYSMINEKELACEFYHKALQQIAKETRPDKTKIKEYLNYQIKNMCVN
ncbi:MAG: tetratricopeptide repeat protein [Arcticibacter sp.]